MLVRAIAKLADQEDLPNWHVVVAGRGGEEGRLRELVLRSGLTNQVTLLGLRADVADLLKAADVFVLPSFSEGLPSALLEAMFAARPVVASAVGGIPDVVEDDRTGLLVPPGDAAALGTTIRRLMASPELRGALGAAGYAHFRSEYSADRMTEAYLQLYGRPGRLNN